MKEKRFVLRLPEDLYDAIEEIANEELRSANAQIITILRDFVAQRKPNWRREKSENREENRTPILAAA